MGKGIAALRVKSWLILACLTCCLPPSHLFAEFPAPGPDASGGVKLSEAMDSAAKGDKSDLGGSSSDDDDCDEESDYDGWVAFLFSIHGVSYDQEEYLLQVPLDVRYAIPFSGDIRGLTQFTLTPFSVEGEKGLLGLYLGGAIVDLEPGSRPDRGTEDQWMLETGLTFRRYLNRSHTALSPYISGNFGFVSLNWDYRNPIVAGGDTIDDDSLLGLEGFAGFGISTKRNSHLSFFAEVDIGATGFVGTTWEDFENDVFDAFGFYAFKVGLSFKF
jgi:hypothetical protein